MRWAALSISLPLLLIASCGSSPHTAQLQATVSKYGVQLGWSENDQSATGYNVYRLDGSGAPVKINDTAIVATWYTDSSVQSGKAYTYDVTAVDQSGAESDPSGQVTVQVP